MARKYTRKQKEPSMPVMCKKCGCKLSEYVLDVEHPVCPECKEPVRLPPLPPADIAPNENKPETVTTPKSDKIEMTLTNEKGHTMTATITPEYGIKTRVAINEIHNLAFNKIGMDSSGKMIIKISFEAETSSDADGINGISEPSIFRIIHMMQQHAKMGAIITCSKLQTDFMDILDPVSNKRVLAQVSQKDIEDHGFGQTTAPTEAQKVVNKMIEEARVKMLADEASDKPEVAHLEEVKEKQEVPIE